MDYAWSHDILGQYSEQDLRGFLSLEKTPEFEKTPVYKTIVNDVKKKHAQEKSYTYQYATRPKDAKADNADSKAKF